MTFQKPAIPQVATYKGRKYKLVWIGQTKYGQRAHLKFFDDSKDFWADAALVSNIETARRKDGHVWGCDDPACAGDCDEDRP